MPLVSRKTFLTTTALATAALVAGTSLSFKKKNPLLSFSTLGCPDWTLEQIAAFAAQHGYGGIEVRGLQRQLDLPQCAPFATAAAREKTKALLKAKGLRFVGLGSSANLHLKGAERQKNLTDARRFIDLAQQLACPYVRVFPNNLPKEGNKTETLSLIAQGLLQLGQYGKEAGVTVLMETHGDVVWADDLATIMQAAQHTHTGLIWDIANMWNVTKEAPAEVYKKLKKHIHHTHIKDAKLVDGKLQYTLLGEGEVPVFEAIDALEKNNYKGYYSFEWEKMWHPTLPEPEVAFAHYAKRMHEHFKKG